VTAVEQSIAKLAAVREGKVNQAVPEGKVDQAVEQHPRIQALMVAILENKERLKDYERTLVRGKLDPHYTQLDEQIHRDEHAIQEVRKDKELRESVRKELATREASERRDELARLQIALNKSRILERRLKDRIASMWKEAKEATGDTVQLEFKERDLARAEKVLEMIAQRVLQYKTEQNAPAKVTLAYRANKDTTIVDRSGYQRRILLAGLAGFCFPLLLVVGWEWLARRVSDVEQIERHARLPVLGEIARLPVRFDRSHNQLSERAGRNLGLFEESVDSLRTSLVLSAPLRDMQVLAITSASNSEGKTSIALQLAVSIARASSQRVLLIDADMRSPDIHRLLGLRREPGMAEVLSHQCSVQEGIVTDWSNSVHVMPAGKLSASPHKLLGNGALKALLDEVRPLYRYIVIDTPPILPASESLVLARSADVCLICAMRDVSRIDRLRRSSDRLVAAGARPAGIVLNGVPVHEYAHDYGAYYGYSRHKSSET
jgi:polysaccharide biosynthesis transport protein